MDKNVVGSIINFVLKGGPPWGFRIKQRANKVIISKVNCGGRAYKNGLKVNDEIVAVNNLEVDKHPLTLIRQTEDGAQIEGDQYLFSLSYPQLIQITADVECNQLTKLDFTYQLIKHTLNHQLHLTVRRQTDSADVIHPCYYCIEEDGLNEVANESDRCFASGCDRWTVRGHSSVVDDIETVKADCEKECGVQFPEIIYLSDESDECDETYDRTLNEFDGISQRTVLLTTQSAENYLVRNVDINYIVPTFVGQLDTIEEEDEECFEIRADTKLAGLYPLSEYHSQSEEEILSPSEDFADTCVETHVKPIVEPEAGPSSRSADHSDLTPSDIPYAISPQSEESDMSSVTKPSFKARAPKNIWSPGSTTTTSSDSTSTTIPATTASATQTTPTKADLKASTLPHGFRPVSFDATQRDSTLLAIDTSLANSHADSSLLSPSSVSETSIETKHLPPHSPQSPITKYWTLPRHASKDDYNVGAIRQVVTDKAPPPEAQFLYETPNTKYYTLPTAVTEKSTTTIPAPKKFEGIGPTDESGLPLSLRTGVKEEFREDWYKSMFNKLHKFEKPKSDLDEPLKIKLRSHKPEYHFSSKYLKEDERGPAPRNIADYEPGHSSISMREKQMESVNDKASDALASQAEQREKEMHEEHDTLRRPPIPYHRNCVFNALTSTNGYESDSSYIIKKKEPKTVPTPASRSTYCAVQRGDIDIPFSGLQKPAPQPRSHKVGPCPPLKVVEDIGLYQHPPQRPPSPQILSDRAIDEWQKQMNADFNDIYRTLQKKQDTYSQCSNTSKQNINSYTENFRPERYTKSETPFLDKSVKNVDENKSVLDSLIQQIEAEADIQSNEDSKHKYEEDEVNIHFKSPIRQLIKDDSVSDEQLAKRQRDEMRRFYENEFERRHLKESQSNAQRRHHFTPKQEHIVHLDRYQRAYSEKESTQLEHNLLARVLFDFHALSSRELSAKKGDIVIVIRPVNHNWVEVEDSQSGLRGLVPRNYLDFEKEGSAKAKYDFEPKTPVEVKLKKSEIIRLLRKVDENWFEGINSKGEVGIFPCSYVEILKPPLYLQLNNNRYSYRPFSPTQQYSRSLSPVCPPSPSRVSRSLNGLTHAHKEPEGTTLSTKKLYRVLYPYKPQQNDELELLAGDILTVTMHCDDGWFVGHSTLTGQYGTFPGNYVELLM